MARFFVMGPSPGVDRFAAAMFDMLVQTSAQVVMSLQSTNAVCAAVRAKIAARLIDGTPEASVVIARLGILDRVVAIRQLATLGFGKDGTLRFPHLEWFMAVSTLRLSATLA
jgi:hypothetical protein